MREKRKGTEELGRNEEICPEELLKRYAALKRVIEDNWPRIGLLLPKIKKADELKAILNGLPNAPWLPPFRDFPMGCLLNEGSTQVEWREVRKTRVVLDIANNEERELSSVYQGVYQEQLSLRQAYNAGAAEARLHQHSKESETILTRIAQQLGIEELEAKAIKLRNLFRDAQKRRQFFTGLLSSQEAWLARNEVVQFVRDPERRYSKTPENFAKAMAGLPVYDWLYSLRKCSSVPGVKTIPKTYDFQIFELLQKIVRKTKPRTLEKIELKLKKRLLQEPTNSPLRSHIAPYWHYMTLAFADWRGQRLDSEKLPFKVMERYLHHFDSPGPIAAELAKRNQLR